MAVPWRATHELAGSCQFEAFGDGFTCLLHNENCGKGMESTTLRRYCKGKSEKIKKRLLSKCEFRPQIGAVLEKVE
ncbi:MAG: hypothetical protein ACI81V_000616 [Lentimonas sp.]